MRSYGPVVTAHPVRWRQLVATDPVPWLLACDEPFARWVTLRGVLGCPADDHDVREARAATLRHPAVRGLLDDLPDWEQPVRSHGAPTYGPNLLHLLADLGVGPGDDPSVERLLDQMLEHCTPDGRFQSYATFIRLREPAWGSVACDHDAITEALVRFGRADDLRVRRALELLAGDVVATTSGLGCRCWPHTITRGRGPGRVADPCPQATIEALRTFGRLPLLERPVGLPQVAQAALSTWRTRAEHKPYMFGHGSHFTTVKWPNVWYSVLWVLQALAAVPAVWSGPAADPADRRAAAELVACLAAANLDGQTRVVPQSVYRGFEAFSFGQKREPSPVATAWVCAMLVAFDDVADDAAAVDVAALEPAKDSAGVRVAVRA
jgi:hypothetical protein